MIFLAVMICNQKRLKNRQDLVAQRRLGDIASQGLQIECISLCKTNSGVVDIATIVFWLG